MAMALVVRELVGWRGAACNEQNCADYCETHDYALL
jgi:hypothetical protein